MARGDLEKTSRDVDTTCVRHLAQARLGVAVVTWGCIPMHCLGRERVRGDKNLINSLIKPGLKIRGRRLHRGKTRKKY